MLQLVLGLWKPCFSHALQIFFHPFTLKPDLPCLRHKVLPVLDLTYFPLFSKQYNHLVYCFADCISNTAHWVWPLLCCWLMFPLAMCVGITQQWANWMLLKSASLENSASRNWHLELFRDLLSFVCFVTMHSRLNSATFKLICLRFYSLPLLNAA
jgi:hypothetical protein